LDIDRVLFVCFILPFVTFTRPPKKGERSIEARAVRSLSARAA